MKGHGFQKMLKSWINKHMVFLRYTFFGIFTAAINWGSFAVLSKMFFLNYISATIIAWVLSISFSFFANRLWVFKSGRKSAMGIFMEGLGFFVFRALSGAVDVGVMFVGVDILHMNELLMKIIANAFVVAVNYFFSQLLFVHIKRKNDGRIKENKYRAT